MAGLYHNRPAGVDVDVVQGVLSHDLRPGRRPVHPHRRRGGAHRRSLASRCRRADGCGRTARSRRDPAVRGPERLRQPRDHRPGLAVRDRIRHRALGPARPDHPPREPAVRPPRRGGLVAGDRRLRSGVRLPEQYPHRGAWCAGCARRGHLDGPLAQTVPDSPVLRDRAGRAVHADRHLHQSVGQRHGDQGRAAAIRRVRDHAPCPDRCARGRDLPLPLC